MDSLHWIRICKYLSEKGEAIVARIIDKQKTYYVPAQIIDKQPNQIVVEYWNGEQGKITDPNDYQIILNNPEGKPDLIELEKSVDFLVSIKDKISRERINLPPRLILRSSRIPTEEEIARLRRDFEGDDFIFAVPSGVKLPIETGSFFLQNSMN